MLTKKTGTYMGLSATWSIHEVASDDQPTQVRGVFTFGNSSLSVVKLFRWCAANGWNESELRELTNRIGIPVADGTINAQTKDGRGQKAGKAPLYGPIPIVPPKEAAQLEGIRKSLTGISSESVRSQAKPGYDGLITHVEAELPASPIASDIAEPVRRQECTTYRIIRDTKLARRVKALHKNECQMCGHTIVLPGGRHYSEGHHIKPLGKDHEGPDLMQNIICVCPNHHAELDYGVRPLSLADLRTVPGHSIGEEYIRYHNEVIYSRVTSEADDMSSARRAGTT